MKYCILYIMHAYMACLCFGSTNTPLGLALTALQNPQKH